MPNYLRSRIPGGTYFFTVTLQERGSTLLIDRIADLRAAFAAMHLRAPIRCEAMVILPDHLHAVWTLPPGDADFSGRWRQFKYNFTKAVGKHAHPTRSASKMRKREAGVWQRRFWEHVIRDERDHRAHVEYCWGNPVKHGLVRRAVDWPHSSIHRDIRLGRVVSEWCGGHAVGDFGEP